MNWKNKAFLAQSSLMRALGTKNKINSENISPEKLYAGNILPSSIQYKKGFYGLAKDPKYPRDVFCDLTKLPLPFPDSSCMYFQSEDVFEHIELNEIPLILYEIHRIMKSGGVFRISLPDYNAPLMRSRAVKSDNGEILFDPGGGGRLDNGRVVGGGHVWFPTLEIVESLLNESPFSRFEVLHYTSSNGEFHKREVDHSLMKVGRCCDFDPRCQNPDSGMSIIADAFK